jgi:hypothetical protein
MASETASESRPECTRPATILLVAIWVGLIAGFLDLGLMNVVKRLTGGDFYHLGDHFRWIIPAGVGAPLPATALALIARFRRGSVSLGLACGLLSFIGFLD